jgi:N-carbamoylputrescine amidase
MKTIRVTAASTPAHWGQTDANIDKAVAVAEQAAAEGAKLLLLPECCLTGGEWCTGAKTPTVEDVSLDIDGPEIARLSDTARRTDLVIAAGFYEKRGGGIYVTQALLGPAGPLGAYRKVHEGKRSSCEADLFPVFDLPFARVGISICRDNMLPECARILALKGAELLLAPFMSLPLSRKEWRLNRLLALRVRAQDNRLFVLSCSHAMPHAPGKPAEWGYSGICCAVDPLGQVIGESKGRAGSAQRLTVTLDESLRRTYVLADVPAIRDRRPADYRELLDPDLQRRYVEGAPPFQYNEHTSRLTVPPAEHQRTFGS